VSGPLVVLVGPPGSGKSTVGRLVADRRGVAFRDTDDDVQRREGRTITELFVEEGEQYFRSAERTAVRAALAEHSGGVLAVGGGAVLDVETRTDLRPELVVFLDVSPDQAAQRVGLNRDRPLLLGQPRATLRRLLAERRPLYLEVADVTVPTDGRTPADVAADVLAVLP
jgi:shikimate kinase